jgi:hypothetical protein
VQARADSDWVQSLAFLHHHGFSETMRMHRLVLDVATATLAPFADAEHRPARARRLEGIFRPNGDNPIRTGNAVLQVGHWPVEVLVVDWQAAPSAGGNAMLSGRGDWPL